MLLSTHNILFLQEEHHLVAIETTSTVLPVVVSF
jgi:hypothetical protein